MRWAGVAAALTAVWLLGTLSLRVLRASPRGVEVIVAGLVTGTAVIATMGSVTIAAGLTLSAAALYAMLGVVVLLAWRSPQHGRTEPPARITALAGVLLFCAAAIVLAISVAALHDRLWWDGWAIWTFKARVLFADGTLPPAFLSADYSFTHLDYPLAVPLLDWWVWRHVGDVSYAAASFVGAVWFAMLPLLLWSSLREHVDGRIAALAALGMAAFWPIAFYATGGTADVVLAVSLLGALIELHRAANRHDKGALVRCGVFLSLGVLSKNEGLAIALIVVLAAVWALQRSALLRQPRAAALAAPFAVLAPWWLFAGTLDAREAVMAPSSVDMLSHRLPFLVDQLLSLILSIPWLPLAFLGTAGILAAVSKRRWDVAPGWFILAAYAAVVCTIYLLTPHDLAWLLRTSLPRVLSVFVPALVWLSVMSTATAQPRERIS